MRLNFWSVPEELWDAPEELAELARSALAFARREAERKMISRQPKRQRKAT